MIRDLDDKGLGFLLVTSSLSPLSCRLFLIASLGVRLGALRSTSYRSSSLPLGRLGGLDCWPSHRWYSVDCRRGRCWLIRMVLVERADELPKVLDR